MSDTKTNPITKQEVAVRLSQVLRNDDLPDKVYIKVLTAYAKLQGWIR
jgi:hypothetical protein